MGLNSDGFSNLSARDACKCMPADESISIENVLVAIGREIGAQNIMSASRMNKAIVVFLKEIEMVSHLVEFGLTVQDVFVPVLPLSNLSRRQALIILSAEFETLDVSVKLTVFETIRSSSLLRP